MDRLKTPISKKQKKPFVFDLLKKVSGVWKIMEMQKDLLTVNSTSWDGMSLEWLITDWTKSWNNLSIYFFFSICFFSLFLFPDILAPFLTLCSSVYLLISLFHLLSCFILLFVLHKLSVFRTLLIFIIWPTKKDNNFLLVILPLKLFA